MWIVHAYVLYPSPNKSLRISPLCLLTQVICIAWYRMSTVTQSKALGPTAALAEQE